MSTVVGCALRRGGRLDSPTVLAAVGATAALLVPLAPVRQEVATYSWPVGASTAPVGIPLDPYHPEALAATFSCDTVAALAGRSPDATVLATTPTETPEGHRDGLVVRVVDGELRITSRGRVVLTEPVRATDGCAWRLVSAAGAPRWPATVSPSPPWKRTSDRRCSVSSPTSRRASTTSPACSSGFQ